MKRFINEIIIKLSRGGGEIGGKIRIDVIENNENVIVRVVLWFIVVVNWRGLYGLRIFWLFVDF